MHENYNFGTDGLIVKPRSFLFNNIFYFQTNTKK
jgi:hypothetical protein